MEQEKIIHIFQRARENAFDAYATWYLFNRRVRRYKLLINFTTWLGICLPASIGLLIAFNGKPFFNYFLISTIILGVFQFLLTAWSLVSRVTDTYSNAVKCREQNVKLKSMWQKFIDLRGSNDNDIQNEFESLIKFHREVEIGDVAQNVKPSELSRGHRAALIAFDQECARCNNKPAGMKPSTCPVCGNFKRFFL